MQTRRRVVIGFEAGRSSAPDGLITSDVANHQDDNEQLAVHTGRWRGVAGRAQQGTRRSSVRPTGLSSRDRCGFADVGFRPPRRKHRSSQLLARRILISSFVCSLIDLTRLFRAAYRILTVPAENWHTEEEEQYLTSKKSLVIF